MVEAAQFRPAESEPAAFAAHPNVRECLAYWRQIRSEGETIPRRRDLDPAGMPKLLPHLWMLDVIRSPAPRYRYRLIGGAIVEAGLPAKRGDWFDEAIPKHQSPELIALFDQVTALPGLIDWRRGPPQISHSTYIAGIERLLLPLKGDGESIDIVLGCTVFHWTDGRVD